VNGKLQHLARILRCPRAILNPRAFVKKASDLKRVPLLALQITPIYLAVALEALVARNLLA
jgi:hypothetical protein